MTATKSEARHFHWHCRTAAELLDRLEFNTATGAHIGRALRMATLTAVGKAGIHFASRGAHLRKGESGKDWPALGLIREHVVPVSVVLHKVRDAHASKAPITWRELVPHLAQEDLHHWEVIDSDHFLDTLAPFSAIVATIVRQSTVLAWITGEDNALLRRHGLTKTMPANHDGDALARYKACAIELVRLTEAAPA